MNIKNNDILTDNLTDILSDPGFMFIKIFKNIWGGRKYDHLDNFKIQQCNSKHYDSISKGLHAT